VRHAWLRLDYLFPILTLIAAALLASDSRSVSRGKLDSSNASETATTRQVEVDHKFVFAQD
jgi:hypothetical protein